jgi:hypothetical protein
MSTLPNMALHRTAARLRIGTNLNGYGGAARSERRRWAAINRSLIASTILLQLIGGRRQWTTIRHAARFCSVQQA